MSQLLISPVEDQMVSVDVFLFHYVKNKLSLTRLFVNNFIAVSSMPAAASECS